MTVNRVYLWYSIIQCPRESIRKLPQPCTDTPFSKCHASRRLMFRNTAVKLHLQENISAWTEITWHRQSGAVFPHKCTFFAMRRGAICPSIIHSSIFLSFPTGTQGPFWGFCDHTQLDIRPLDEWSARRRDLYLHRTTHHINTRDKHPCSQRDSNPRSQQLSGHRPMP
jgi:hypothetical protein